MATLTQKQKRWIVERLACFETPTDVAEAFEEKFRTPVSRSQVANYNASKRQARSRMAQDLVELFDETRAEYRADVEGVPIANKRYRLEQLDRIARDARSPKLQMEAMEQAAKEVGDAFTNTQKLRHTGKDDETPIQTESRVVVTLPDNGRGDRAPGALTPRGKPAGDG